MADLVAPSVDQVGKLIRSRTWDGRGQQLGTFTADTKPTAAEVTVLAEEATNQVRDTLGNNIDSRFAARATSAAALIAAQLVELGADDPRTVVIDQLGKMADSRISTLAREIKEVGAGDEEGPADDSLSPAYSFPAAPLPADDHAPGFWPAVFWP